MKGNPVGVDLFLKRFEAKGRAISVKKNSLLINKKSLC